MLTGIYIHQTKAVPYADDIIRGRKTLETRTRNTLGRFVGQRVFIIRTRSGHEPDVIGTVFIAGCAYRSAEWLDGMRNRTLIPPGSKFDCHGKGKWCYTLTCPVGFDPIPLKYFKVTNRTQTYASLE